MATIQIKHVPETTHAELRRRAEAAHQSLQQYLLRLLDEQVARPTLDDWLASLPVSDDQPVTADVRIRRAPGITCRVEVFEH